MQIITCAIIKGGTGKTAACATLAQCAANEGKRVLCIDLDPQAALTNMLGADRTAPGAYNLLQGAHVIETMQPTKQNIDVIAGAPALVADKSAKGGSAFRLADALEPIKKAYDLIIIDTPPFFCGLTYEALQAATGLIIPMLADYESMQGQKYIIELANMQRRTNKKLKVLGCFINQFDARPRINRYMRERIQEQAGALKCPYLGEISRSVSYLEANALHRNIYIYAPKSKPAQEYKAIYNKIIK